ncbi:hypothetical protein HDC92_001440 [Pedobacter sp. AK017]|uniref:hypothetical protein n=1 Tax=Pedobacter sp. AK017 TaxID=2723073 RepID=UPI001621C404|nr:hypothetical protein [Pedobacter sp. AK017]MBB5437766.1 hypothetical protein [Pedobacter sp. AK017]
MNAQETKKNVRPPFDFKTDTVRSRFISFQEASTSEVNAAYNRSVDSTFHLDKNYIFELRLWKRHLSYNFDDVFILRLKNNKWTARYFDLKDSFGDKTKFTERKVDQTKADQLWVKLVENKVLTIPDEKVLQDRLLLYKIDSANIDLVIQRISMTDGVLYGFELSTPDKKRHFSYSNPESLLKYYGNVEELYRVVIINMLIQKFLELQ